MNLPNNKPLKGHSEISPNLNWPARPGGKTTLSNADGAGLAGLSKQQKGSSEKFRSKRPRVGGKDNQSW